MEQRTAFVGDVPQKYDRYMGPIFFEPYAQDLAERFPAFPAIRVLELACGTGIVTRALRDRLPADARVVATDLNQPMIDQARKRFESVDAVEWRQADALHLPFEPESFDAVVCQFGVMFFPDKGAFRAAHRVLAPGGVLMFSAWDALEKNELSRVAADAIAACFPDDPPDFFETPFGFHDRDVIRDLLLSAGFAAVDIATVEKPSGRTSASDAATALVEGTPMIMQLVARSSFDLAQWVGAVARAIRARFGDPVESTMTALVCTAAKAQRNA